MYNAFYNVYYIILIEAVSCSFNNIILDEEEKEQLIKQVLSLSDEQVALLPPDQRESIIQLREQLKKQAMAGL